MLTSIDTFVLINIGFYENIVRVVYDGMKKIINDNLPVKTVNVQNLDQLFLGYFKCLCVSLVLNDTLGW